MADTTPIYPDFKKIGIEDCSLFDCYCNKYLPYSDFNLLSLLSWNAAGVNAYSILNGNLVIRIKNYLGDGFLYSIMGENEIDESFMTLLKTTDKLSFVPESVILKIENPTKFNKYSDRDNDDYILSTEKIIKLEGRDLKHLRQDTYTFNRLYPSHVIKVLDLADLKTKTEVVELTEKWYVEKNFDEAKKQEETVMLDAFLKYSAYFNCLFLGLYVENSLIAYIFNEILSSRMAISHFGVSNRDFKCSLPMMEYETSKYLFEKGYLHQNMEQDTGLPGLRKSKLFFSPEYFLKKYTVTLA